jgi:hypothetical protein
MRSAREGGSRASAPAAASLSGPFVPAAKEPPKPKPKPFNVEWDKLTNEQRAERARAAMRGMFGPPEDEPPKKPPDDDDDIGHFLKF